MLQCGVVLSCARQDEHPGAVGALTQVVEAQQRVHVAEGGNVVALQHRQIN